MGLFISIIPLFFTSIFDVIRYMTPRFYDECLCMNERFYFGLNPW